MNEKDQRRKERTEVSSAMFHISQDMKQAETAIRALQWFDDKGDVSDARPAKNIFTATIAVSNNKWPNEDEALYYLRQAFIQHQDDILKLAKKMAEAHYNVGKAIVENDR